MNCGKVFETVPWAVRAGVAQYCSRACYAKARTRRVTCTCTTCGRAFDVLPSMRDRGVGVYCSQACFQAARQKPLAERFWKYVERPADPDACWIWQGGGRPYGRIVLDDGKLGVAHRVSYELHTGMTIPDDLLVRHLVCDNPMCVNPRHLALGTSADNSADMVAKQRNPRGTQHKRAKLTPTAVREIRRLAAERFSLTDIARHFGVHRGTVASVVKRETWGHVQDDE